MDVDVTKVKPPVRWDPSAAQALVTHVFHYLTHLNKWFFFFFFSPQFCDVATLMIIHKEI
jgi:hypothetical protein